MEPERTVLEGNLLKRSEWLQQWNKRHVKITVDGTSTIRLEWQGGQKSGSIVVEPRWGAAVLDDGELTIRDGAQQVVCFRSAPGEGGIQEWIGCIQSEATAIRTAAEHAYDGRGSTVEGGATPVPPYERKVGCGAERDLRSRVAATKPGGGVMPGVMPEFPLPPASPSHSTRERLPMSTPPRLGRPSAERPDDQWWDKGVGPWWEELTMAAATACHGRRRRFSKDHEDEVNVRACGNTRAC